MLTAAELAQMQAVQQESMIDTCVIVTTTTTAGAYGGQQVSTADSEPTPCGLSFNTAAGMSSRRISAERGPLASVDAVLRLPLAAGAVLNATSQIRITGRNGAACTPQTYTIEGPVMPGRTCLIVGLKRVGV
jgi:hypothetical protein